MVNQNDFKKLRERFFLDCFAKARGLDFLTVESRESPDFMVSLNGECIGIEVTDFFNSSNLEYTLRANEASSEHVIIKAKKIYETFNNTPLRVSVSFYPGIELSKINRDKMAKALAGFVLSKPLMAGQTIDYKQQFLKNELPLEIAFVHILGLPSDFSSHWFVARVGWVPKLNAIQLQEAVDKKSMKIDRYKTAVKENWLVIVVDSFKPSRNCNIDDDFNSQSIVSPFSKTYLYKYPDNLVLPLGI